MAKKVLCPKCRNQISLPTDAPREAVECPLCGVVLPLVVARRRDSDPLIGKAFAYFHVIDKIGQGAMAAVYLVKNLNLGRPSALKLLHNTVVATKDKAERRFIREAKSAARIDHPNVLSVYHVSQHEGRYFIEMQYADGGALNDLLEGQGPLDPKKAARLIRDAAAGIGAAHKQGVIHRDVKPSNIMLMKDGTVKVADFGLAKFEDGGTDLTSDGIVLGTPLYMSPEQVAGQEANEASDIYSLGITFYELLTGSPPFQAPTPAAVLYMHVYEPLPSLKKAASMIPDSICEIVDKMTRKDPAARYASCAEAVSDLDRVLAGDRDAALAHKPAAAAPHADLKVNVVNIFRTMARFGVVASGSGEMARAGLMAKAKELGVTESQAQQIIEQTIMESMVSDPGAPAVQTIGERQQQIEGEILEQQRRERVSRSRSLFIRFVVVAGLMLLALGVYGVLSMGRRTVRETTETKKAEESATTLSKQVESLLRSARQQEARRDWQGAAEKYEGALALSGGEDARKALAAVKQVIRAEEFEKAGKWDEAEEAYKAALGGVYDKRFVEARLSYIETYREYMACRATAETARKERRWDEAVAALSRAAAIAKKIDLASDIEKEIEEVKGRKLRAATTQQTMDGLFNVCRGRKDLFALLAAAEHYLRLPAYQAHQGSLEKVKAEALKGISSAKESLRVDEKAQCRRIKLKSGESFSGVLTDEQPQELEVLVCRNDTRKKYTFKKNTLESVEDISPQILNKQTASGLLEQALAESKTNSAYHALCLLGHLQAEFEKEIAPETAGARPAFDAAWSGALHAAAAFCEGMCPGCVGKGRVACPKCKGTGGLVSPCDQCRELRDLPICEPCRGGGVRLSGVCKECSRGKKICTKCNGKGCKFCGFKGKWPCPTCRGTGRGETKLLCNHCAGTGRIGEERCPRCFGRGKLPCKECGGTGRQMCPKCKNTKTIMVKCGQCGEDFTVECTACRGAGKK